MPGRLDERTRRESQAVDPRAPITEATIRRRSPAFAELISRNLGDRCHERG